MTGFCLGTERGMSKKDCVRPVMAWGACNAMFSKIGYVEPDPVWQLFGQIKPREILHTP